MFYFVTEFFRKSRDKIYWEVSFLQGTSRDAIGSVKASDPKCGLYRQSYNRYVCNSLQNSMSIIRRRFVPKLQLCFTLVRLFCINIINSHEKNRIIFPLKFCFTIVKGLWRSLKGNRKVGKLLAKEPLLLSKVRFLTKKWPFFQVKTSVITNKKLRSVTTASLFPVDFFFERKLLNSAVGVFFPFQRNFSQRLHFVGELSKAWLIQ